MIWRKTFHYLTDIKYYSSSQKSHAVQLPKRKELNDLQYSYHNEWFMWELKEWNT